MHNENSAAHIHDYIFTYTGIRYVKFQLNFVYYRWSLMSGVCACAHTHMHLTLICRAPLPVPTINGEAIVCSSLIVWGLFHHNTSQRQLTMNFELRARLNSAVSIQQEVWKLSIQHEIQKREAKTKEHAQQHMWLVHLQYSNSYKLMCINAP